MTRPLGPTTLASAAALAVGLLAAPAAHAAPTSVTVTITNLAPTGGTFLTPLWVGFHDGSFDVYDAGSPVTPGLERLVEDGSTNLPRDPLPSLSEEFRASDAAASPGGLDDALPANVGFARPGFAVLAPGATLTKTFTLDGADPADRFFSYASMVIPSNDFFIASAAPIPVFDAAGKFVGADLSIGGSAVLDAGSEVNDEVPANTAFFGQSTDDVGVPEGGVVTPATGYKPPGSGGVLDDPRFANADFTAPGYEVARITVSEVTGPAAVPLPSAAWAFLPAAALGGLAYRRQRGREIFRRIPL